MEERRRNQWKQNMRGKVGWNSTSKLEATDTNRDKTISLCTHFGIRQQKGRARGKTEERNKDGWKSRWKNNTGIENVDQANPVKLLIQRINWRPEASVRLWPPCDLSAANQTQNSTRILPSMVKKTPKGQKRRNILRVSNADGTSRERTEIPAIFQLSC